MKLYNLLLISLVLSFGAVQGQTTKTIGASGDYLTVKAAFDAVNAGTITGSLTLQIISGTTETASAVLKASGTGSANYSSLSLYPTATGLTIAGNISAPLIDLNGADNVLLDGRVNQAGASSLTLTNTNAGTFGTAIRFITSAENNTIKYCNINASCFNAGVGMINFTSSITGNGNDNNIIEFCNITNASGNRPVNAIFSSGSAGRENSGNIIRSNNIFNFFNANATSFGINVSNGSSNWTVTGNSFYETTVFAPAGAYKYYPIFVNVGDNNVISNNYIGGSEPLCGGSALTINANTAHYFCGIYFNGGVASTVQNNTIRNINFTGIQSNPWDGILINSGNANITGNTIGASTGNGSVIISTPSAVASATMSGGVVTSIELLNGGSGYTTAPVITFSASGNTSQATATSTISGGVVTTVNLVSGGTGYTVKPSVIFDGQSNGYSTSHGMIQSSTGTVNITNNTIGSITTVGTSWYSHGFESMYLRGASGICTVSNNLIGSLTTPNSIFTSSGAANSLLKQDIFGIYNGGTATLTTISGNTIANLTNGYTGINGGSRTRGIQTIYGSNSIQNNTVRNITTANGVSGTRSSASVIGISQTASTVGTTQTVTGNIVYALSNTNATSKVDVYGILYAGPTAGIHLISENFVHSISVSSSNLASEIEGIQLYGGLTTCANNIINLGTGIVNGYSINGIWDECSATNSNSIYFNSVYIGGNVVSGTTSSTAALKNFANNSVRNYRNNILVNARTGGTTGFHFAIIVAGMANVTIDYNDYFVAGAKLGRIGSLDKADLSAWKLGTGQDVNSLSLDPGFTVAGGTTALNYYASAVLPGVTGTGTETDYAGLTRGSTPKMGALETNNFVWQGAINTDFGLAANWAGSIVPPDGADIAFATNPNNSCILDQNRIIGKITNSQSAKKLITNGKQLTINKDLNFTNGAQIDATSNASEIVFAGSIAQNIPSGAFVSNTVDALSNNNIAGITLNGDLIISQTLSLTHGAFSIGSNTLFLNGSVSSAGGTLTGGSTSNITIGGTGAGTNLPTVTLNNFTINRVNGLALGGNVIVGGTLALTNGTLSLEANLLTIAGSALTRTNGFIDASNAGATIEFTNTTAIILPSPVFAGTVNNLTLNGAGGITAGSDFTVNGLLNLVSANPSAIKGGIDMWDGSMMKTLTMGANATAIGNGDVTGIVKRTAFSANVPYTFGNQFTRVTFTPGGTYPTQLQVKIRIGSSPSWKPTAIERIYDFVQTGGSECIAAIVSHYLDTELNNNIENELVQWTNGTPGPPSGLFEWGRSNLNSTDNWVGIANVNIGYFPSVFGQLENTLSKSELPSYTWNGSQSTLWTTIENWTPVGNPSSASNIIIPDASTTSNDPILPVTTSIRTITINSGGILNGATGAVITITGGAGAWLNTGTFNPVTSTVIFTSTDATISGSTDFYNITVADGAGLMPGSGNTMRIAGALNMTGTSIIQAAQLPNTIEFNGIDQTIIIPNGTPAGYHNLILSGSGIKSFPANTLSIAGDFSTAGTATATPGASISIGGNMTIGNGSAFTTGNFNHSVGGNFSNDGTFTASAGNTITMSGISGQLIEGSTSTNFDNLTINNINGVNILVSSNINNVLSLENGTLHTGAITLGINGSISKTAGNIGVSPVSSLSFGGTAALTLASNMFSTPPSISNLIINRTGGVTLGNQDITVNGLLNLQSGTISLGENTLTIAGVSPTRTNGFINAGNAGATLIFSNTEPILLPASIFTGNVNNLTVNATGGITASSDFIIDGILHLQSENPSEFKGSLDLWDGTAIKTLTMGALATTTGIGDVTGIIKRTSFVANTPYTFGNQFSNVTLSSGGTIPAEIKLKISIGTFPSWKPDAIKRIYEYIHTGGSNCLVTLAVHYLDAELNGNDENGLVMWGNGTPGPMPGVNEFGRSNSNPIENWVAVANVNIGYFPTGFGQFENTFAESDLASYIWNGSQSTSWINQDNWTPPGSPSSISSVVIPDASTTMHSPTLAASTEVKNLTIEASGILNAVSNEQLAINGDNGAWSNADGTFNPALSNVTFVNNAATLSGITDFKNVTINAGATLSLTAGSIMRIAGAITNNGIFHAVTGGTTTVEYNGGNQTVIIPNSATHRYSELILSGSGIKTMPSSPLDILGDLNLYGSVSAVTNSDIIVAGNLNIGNGTNLTVGSGKNVTVAGSLTNNSGIAGLVIKSGASGTGSLLNNSTGVQASVERYINGVSWAWHFLSSPVASQSISGSFTPGGAGNDFDFYTWYEPQLLWVNFKNTTSSPTWNTANGSTNFLPGRGYLVAYEANYATKTFGGLLNSGQVSYALTTGGGSTYQYYNLVGNPYPCAIDWKAPIGWNMANLSGADKSYWVWNDATGNYGAYTTAISGDIGTNGVTRYISSGQGFFVLASSAGSFTMDDGIKVKNAQAYLKNGESLNEELQLRLSCSANTYSDEAIVAFNNSDPLAGSEKFSSMYTQAPELWTEKNGNNYSINFMGDLTTEKVIPLTIKAGLAGNYTLTASQMESFGTNQVILLEDRETGNFTNMAVIPSYTFPVNQSSIITGRFFLHFKNSEVGISNQEVNTDFRVYTQEGKLFIQSAGQQSGKVTVTDMAGRNIANSQVEAGATIQINLSGHSGVYIVSVLTAKGKSNTKIIVR